MNDPHPFTAPTANQLHKCQRGVRWWLILAIFGVPIVVLALGTLLVRVGYTLRESSGRQAMIEELRKLADEGQPIGNEAIDDLYSSRTSSDDTQTWLNLFTTVESVAIAIRGHVHRFGELPNNLDDLPDAIARLHPLGNKPFSYERQEDQAVLWGFDVTRDLRRTPTSPPAIEAGVAGGMDSYRFVWHIKRNAN